MRLFITDFRFKNKNCAMSASMSKKTTLNFHSFSHAKFKGTHACAIAQSITVRIKILN